MRKKRKYDIGKGMLSDFFTFLSLDSDDSEGTVSWGGNFSISLRSLSIRFTFRYRPGRSFEPWGGTRPLIIPFIAHRGLKEGCKRTRKRRSVVPPMLSLRSVPTSAPPTTTALNAPSSMKQSVFPVARRRRLLNFRIYCIANTSVFLSTGIFSFFIFLFLFADQLLSVCVHCLFFSTILSIHYLILGIRLEMISTVSQF